MARPPAVETVSDLRHGLTRVGRWPAAGAARRAWSCEAPAGVAAAGADAIEGELVVDGLGEGPGVAGEPDVVFAEPAAALVEVGFEPAGPVEEVGVVALEATPLVLGVVGASYCEYLMTIAVTSMSLAASGALC
jgi:hypothetical protein